jgi:hypothetical protein
MAKHWRIMGYDGDKLVFERPVLGKTTPSKVKEMLARLQSRHLSDDEVFESCTGEIDQLKVIIPVHGPDFVTIGMAHRYEAWEQDD